MAVPSSTLPDPDVKSGLNYWANQPANYDGVLGGFGTGSLPRIDALTSRQLLLYLFPELCTVASTSKPLNRPQRVGDAEPQRRRTRALDVGAGVGRVTADVLLHVFDDVLLVEPVDQFIQEAYRRGNASAAPSGDLADANEAEGYSTRWKAIKEETKSVTFVRSTLQSFEPGRADASAIIGRVGYQPGPPKSAVEGASYEDINSGFDVIWCQWCLGHLSDPELIQFLGRAVGALRDRNQAAGENPSCIVVKENLCRDFGEDGVEAESGKRGPRTVFDEEDSSLTRSDLAWKAVFSAAGLTVVREQLQLGFPEGLYDVKIYVLRPRK
ncbi:methyltransferase domain-containing protein [Punctularia strigosozonata HHB-11173 SS5]|uniref:methyltransferase domain-containing protein n=1 Tax=Punctularia strigosozonata (strain HHB-11173) TaxID=741275 RepID=UPI0004417EB7|nr:methyltransferase domain-containing protein [Punctularia strigosozonata HHB-11173 SS5]EIN07311.1 methyltransferase domain-containing protein [Punctularia strigosozonata HHB-11173 SS5]